MNVYFECYCPLQFGESLWLSGSPKNMGSLDKEQAIPMEYTNESRWTITVNIKEKSINYRFYIKNLEGTLIPETCLLRHFKSASKGFSSVELFHNWGNRNTIHKAFESSLFTETIFGSLQNKTKRFTLPPKTNNIIVFELNEVNIPENHKIFISGNHPVLGNWDPEKALMLNNAAFPKWQLALPRHNFDAIIEYKYFIKNTITNQVYLWEDGENRRRHLTEKAETYTYINDGYGKFNRPNWKGAGISIPVFSLRTKTSFGVGEFTDLKKMIDWSSSIGMKIIQILPINDTIASNTFLDSYPYKAISVFALHPIYLNVFKAGKLKDINLLNEFKQQAEQLNKLDAINYTEVINAKTKYLKLLYLEKGASLLKSKNFKEFYTRNQQWLNEYAVFCTLREQYNTTDFTQWEENSKLSTQQINDYCTQSSPLYETIGYYFFIQYHLDKQLKEITEYGKSKGVALKGDIPIGISRHSVDAWAQPELYHFNQQAGAPPDDFSEEGQNWGFPTYNWSLMRENNYKWWHSRMQKMADYFDAYRIDHILGFFRIWEIPLNAIQGLLGHFRPALPMHQHEIEQWHIPWDFNRYCKPYIRGHFLEDIFGAYESVARNTYLNEISFSIFELKEEYNSQDKIYNHFIPKGQGPESLNKSDRILYEGLLQLVAEVLFIEDEDTSNHFHPRISIEKTYSFKELDAHVQHQLKELYIHFYYNRHEEFWRSKAEKKLPGLVDATNMLVCGEDLGMIPATVPVVMDKLGILSLEIQRMPKNNQIEFANPANAPYLSVCTTSTHDMSTIRGWWEENPEVSQRFYNHQLGKSGEKPLYADSWLCQEIINQHLHSPAMWTIFPLQDLWSIDESIRPDDPHSERINIPSNPRHYWQYRMHLSLEELIKNKGFTNKLKQMLSTAGR